MKKIVVAITGASGSIYARQVLRKLELLNEHWSAVDIVMTENARQVWQTELDDNKIGRASCRERV